MKYGIGLVLVFITYFTFNSIGEVGLLDTTCKADPGIQIFGVIAAIAVFIFIAFKSGNSSWISSDLSKYDTSNHKRVTLVNIWVE